MDQDTEPLPMERFSAAAAKWLSTRSPYVKERTLYMDGHHIQQLNKFLGPIPLGRLHIGNVREYQRARLANSLDLADGSTISPWKKKAGPSLINHEMSVVQKILKRKGIWKKRFALYYDPLPMPGSQKPKVMTEEEEHRLFAIASSSPEFELAFLVASLSVNTTAAGAELRHVRLRDVSLAPPRLVIDAATAKNKYRSRTIPLNPTASVQMAVCLQRARAMGSSAPEHYLFPKRIVPGLWDPYQPASTSWLRNSFKAMREAAGMPWLTPHCLRHQAITKLLELGTAPEVVKGIAGHISDAMMRHYFHGRYAAAADALSQIDSSKKPSKK